MDDSPAADLRIRVYLAGKISGSRYWRDRMVKWSFDGKPQPWNSAIKESCDDWQIFGNVYTKYPKSWPIIPNGFLGFADYVGPYAIQDGDSGTHCEPVSMRRMLYASQSDWEPLRTHIVGQCFSAIDSADIVVAVLTGDSPGTLCEIGYAHAKNRPVVAFVRDGYEWDWFPQSLCKSVVKVPDSPCFANDIAERLSDGPNGSVFDLINTKSDMPAYYKTSWWRRRRAAVIERAAFKCALCSATDALEVHHNCYTNLYREPDSDLTVLCEKCHTAADARRREQEKSPAPQTETPF